MEISSREALLQDDDGRGAPAAATLADAAPAPLGELRQLRGGSKRPALLRAMRPRQWAKNVLVLAAPCAAGMIDHASVAADTAGAFVVMCAVSSATYLVNDVRDRHDDRLHPAKCRRPIAAGELSPRAALGWALALALFGLALAAAIATPLLLVAVAYLALTACYSLMLRAVALLDVLTVASCFVLRAFAGAAATDIHLSGYFVIVTGCCATYLVVAKRYAELRERAGAPGARPTLASYSERGLRAALIAAAGGALGGYLGWVVTRPSSVAWYALSMVPLALWLGRYAALINGGAGQAPEELVLSDRILLALSLAWSALFVGGVYAIA